MHSAELWAYYQSNIAPVVAQMDSMIAAAQTIVDAVEAVERAAPGTFGVQISSVAKTETDPIDPQ